MNALSKSSKGLKGYLPPLKRTVLSKAGQETSGIAEGFEQLNLPQRNQSSGSYTVDRIKKNPMHERVLFPTEVKESFL